MENSEENIEDPNEKEIELLKKEISRLKEENKKISQREEYYLKIAKEASQREKYYLNIAKEASQREKESLNNTNEILDKLKKLKIKYKNYENLSENAFNKLINSRKFKEAERAEKLRIDIDNYIKTLSEEERKRIEGLQKYLTNYDNNYKFEENKIKMPLFHTFGENIDNKKFISYIEQEITNLYSSNKKISKNIFKFFQDIEKEIKNFICIPMLKENSLQEFKKHIYLKILTNQLEERDYKILIRYIFYDDEYFNESNFEEISFSITRNDLFIKKFPEYEKNYKFKLNLENIKEYMFSKTIKEAYLETCKDIFDKDASFVNKKNIDLVLNDIYEEIIKKNLKIVKLEKGHFGTSIYSKKIFISQSFIKNIKESEKQEKSITILAMLIRTILKEIMNCLTNYLPSFSKDEKGLSKNSVEILQNNIENYNLISESGSNFERKLFDNESKMNFFNSEYFLNLKNLNQSLKNFKEKMKAFEAKIDESYEFKKLKDETTVIFRSYKNSAYFGKCLLDSKKQFFIE